MPLWPFSSGSSRKSFNAANNHWRLARDAEAAGDQARCKHELLETVRNSQESLADNLRNGDAYILLCHALLQLSLRADLNEDKAALLERAMAVWQEWITSDPPLWTRNRDHAPALRDRLRDAEQSLGLFDPNDPDRLFLNAHRRHQRTVLVPASFESIKALSFRSASQAGIAVADLSRTKTSVSNRELVERLFSDCIELCALSAEKANAANKALEERPSEESFGEETIRQWAHWWVQFSMTFPNLAVDWYMGLVRDLYAKDDARQFWNSAVESIVKNALEQTLDVRVKEVIQTIEDVAAEHAMTQEDRDAASSWSERVETALRSSATQYLEECHQLTRDLVLNEITKLRG